MPEFSYRGRDQEGHLRVGKRPAHSAESLNSELIKEGISPILINEVFASYSFWNALQDRLQNKSAQLQELATFSRQMQLLHQAGVPLVTSLQQLANYTRSRPLKKSMLGVIEYLEKGETLAHAMQNYPNTFSPLMVNLVKIGESTGHLSEAFEHLYRYLEFEISSFKQIKTSFRYPVFVMISILMAIIVLNIFVIPTFARFYQNVTVSLPWQTELLIGMSDITVNYGIYILILLAVAGIFTYRYIHTPKGKYRFDKLMIRLPLVGSILLRVITVRFCQLLSITMTSGIGITQGLGLVKQVISNRYIVEQISQMQETIARGVSFTQAIKKVELFTPLESQILSVGEKNGKLSSALDYIADFHSREIEFDLKRMSDMIGPILIVAVAGLILIIALGVYLPIWDMVNLPH